MKSRMNWDQQALEAWLEESARKDEDGMTLQKYTRQDEAKIKVVYMGIFSLYKVCNNVIEQFGGYHYFIVENHS